MEKDRLMAAEKAMRALSKRVAALEKAVEALSAAKAPEVSVDLLDEWMNGKREGGNG